MGGKKNEYGIPFLQEKGKEKNVPFMVEREESFLNCQEERETIHREIDTSGKKPSWMGSRNYKEDVDELKAKTLELLHHFKKEKLYGKISFRRSRCNEKEISELDENNFEKRYSSFIDDVTNSFETEIEWIEMNLGEHLVTVTNRAAFSCEIREKEERLAGSINKKLAPKYFEGGEINIY